MIEQIFISIAGACMLVFPFYIISLVRSKSPSRKEKLLNQAIKKGHVVTAILKKRHSSVDDPYSRSASGMVDLGVYEYTYKGKKYKYKLYDSNLPSTLKLYFLKNPRKAEEEAGLGSSNTCWPLIIGVIACIIYLIAKSST